MLSVPLQYSSNDLLLFFCKRWLGPYHNIRLEKFINTPCFLFSPDFSPFFNFKFIFLKINFFNATALNAHNSGNIGARDLLLVSFCRKFYLVCLSGLNSKPTTWYLFIWTHTYNIGHSNCQCKQLIT